MIIVNKSELNYSQQINYVLYNFQQTLSKEKLSISKECIQSLLDKMSLLKLHENPNLTCESLTFIDKENFSGNEGITKKFTKKTWDVVKEPLCASIELSFIVGELSTSQKPAIIKLIEKKDRDKRFIKNW